MVDKPLTKNILAGIEPLDYGALLANGAYEGLKNALKLSPKEVMTTVQDAELKGRGGAGFPTGLKWSFVPQGEASASPKYLVCNADEMEPGTFKDRLLLERDPHQLVEGMIISAYAIQADIGYIFIRGEYVEAIRQLRGAIETAIEKNLLGKNILGSDYSFELHIHPSAGRYICGEETALINALEGRRANPRAKPPFPQVSGLWGKPTVVNNVETLCNVPHILHYGVDWYKGLADSKDNGTKLFGVSGRVKSPAVWELPMGTSIREIIEEHAGGMQDGYKLKGFLPGGGSTDFLIEEHLDLAMEYETIGKAGSRMGTGTIIILDDKTCPIGMTHNLTKFYAAESCGWCTPCRDGLPWSTQLLAGIENGTGLPEDIVTLQHHTKMMAPGNTFCALAPGAAEPIQSSLKYFMNEYEDHIKEKRCPYK